MRYAVDGAAVRAGGAGGRAVRGAADAGRAGVVLADGGGAAGDIDTGAIVIAGLPPPRIDRVTWTGAMLTRVDITGLIGTGRAPAVAAPRP